MIDLPQHVQREIYKEGRREIMRPLITMKRPMYDNIMMKGPDGKGLSTISLKKAKWYIKKGLAKWTTDGGDEFKASNGIVGENDGDSSGTTIQLLFHPASSDKDVDLQNYNASFKQNRCVVCGAEQDYMRHYVVPYCYRSLFPCHYKTHLPHDVVIVCPTCHVMAEVQAHRRMKKLEQRERRNKSHCLHPTSAQMELVDGHIHSVRSAATALLKWRDRLPAAKIEAYETLLRDWCRSKVGGGAETSADGSESPSLRSTYRGGGESCEQTSALYPDEDSERLSYRQVLLTEAQLEEASQLESRQPNPNYVAGADLVVDSLKLPNGIDFDDEALVHFVRDWRLHFVECLYPRYLPKGWSVEAAVQSNRRME